MHRTTPPTTPSQLNPHAAQHVAQHAAPHAGPHAAKPAKAIEAPQSQWIDDDPILATVGPGTIDPARWDEDLSQDADALAELFLGEAAFAPPIPPTPHDEEPGDSGDDDDDGDDHDGPQAHVEALVLGHLPVLGSAWVGGYAGIVANRLQRPVGLARLRGGYLTIDAVGLGTAALESTDSLHDALHAISALSGHWLIATDATDEPALIRGGNPSGVTLLTSADDAAIVGSYQAIKGLLESQPGESSWPEDADLTIALAGSPADRSHHAGDKIRSAVRTFLGRRVHLEICPQRINSSAARGVYAGPFTGSITQLASLIHIGAGQSARAASAPAVEPKPVQHNPALHKPAAVSTTAVTPAPAAPEYVAAAVQAPAAPAAHPAPAAVHPQAVQSPTQTATAASLSPFISGLSRIDLVCPYAPAIELALDATGALHLVSSADAFTTLHRAAAWARAHEPLLRAALPTFRSIPASTSPTCHVISEDPSLLRPLIESDVRVHLLVKLAVGTQDIAIARPLN